MSKSVTRKEHLQVRKRSSSMARDSAPLFVAHSWSGASARREFIPLSIDSSDSESESSDETTRESTAPRRASESTPRGRSTSSALGARVRRPRSRSFSDLTNDNDSTSSDDSQRTSSDAPPKTRLARANSSREVVRNECIPRAATPTHQKLRRSSVTLLKRSSLSVRIASLRRKERYVLVEYCASPIGNTRYDTFLVPSSQCNTAMHVALYNAHDSDLRDPLREVAERGSLTTIDKQRKFGATVLADPTLGVHTDFDRALFKSATRGFPSNIIGYLYAFKVSTSDVNFTKTPIEYRYRFKRFF